MAAGLGLLGLPPSTFWTMTPRELAAALRSRLGMNEPLSPFHRDEFENLLQRFPDQE